jgi:hypothetical protein
LIEKSEVPSFEYPIVNIQQWENKWQIMSNSIISKNNGSSFNEIIKRNKWMTENEKELMKSFTYGKKFEFFKSYENHEEYAGFNILKK